MRIRFCIGLLSMLSATAAIAAEPEVQSMKFEHTCSRPAPDQPIAGQSDAKPKTTAPRTNIKYPPTGSALPRGTLRPNERRIVVLDLFVTEEGRIAEARIAESSGNSIVDQVAMNDTAQWRMTPGTIDGEAVCMWMKFVTTVIGDGR